VDVRRIRALLFDAFEHEVDPRGAIRLALERGRAADPGVVLLVQVDLDQAARSLSECRQRHERHQRQAYQ
jgi:hypothetical protein